MIQQPKKRIDVGLIGDPTKGDILFDGGVKINSVIDNVYNAFGDYRLYTIADGVDKMVLHPIGYYQKMTSAYYASQKIDHGSLHDVTTKDGSQVISLPEGKAGEGVCIINTDGTFSTENPLYIRPFTGESIYAVPGDLKLSVPFSKVTLFCVSSGVGATWRYQLESMFGDVSIPVETTIGLLANQTKDMLMVNKADYEVMKFLVSAEAEHSNDFKACEILLYVSRNDDLHWNEASVLKNVDDIVDISFKIVGDNVNVVAKSNGQPLRVTIKAIDTVKKGIA